MWALVLVDDVSDKVFVAQT